MFAGAPETTGSARALREIVDNIETDLYYRHHDQLGDSFHRIKGKDGLATIPQRNQYLSLVIRVDQANQVAEHDTVLVTHAGPG